MRHFVWATKIRLHIAAVGCHRKCGRTWIKMKKRLSFNLVNVNRVKLSIVHDEQFVIFVLPYNAESFFVFSYKTISGAQVAPYAVSFLMPKTCLLHHTTKKSYIIIGCSK
jgi:hypothetical protein